MSDKQLKETPTNKKVEDKSDETKSKNEDASPLIWEEKVADTALEDFRKKISAKYNIKLENYWDLHKWSIEHFENFWEEIWNYFEMKSSRPHDKVFQRTGDGFLDVEWFPGLLFNPAEALLRYRDDTTAIIYSDEEGNDERVTFAELYEEVKKYAAAFRKQGLKKGDVVGCCMSNRKEAVYIYIAATSVGAIFSGPQPYLGAKAASLAVNRMEPKFYFSIDHHIDNGVEYNNIEDLKEIVESTPSIEKVIIVPTRFETYGRDISDIPNCCFLIEFLLGGLDPDGTIPDIIFEQIPFNHPHCLNFTSGTTGLPKGPVHSAGTIISQLLSIVFYWNLKPGDVLYSYYPVGWTLWNIFVNCLARGVTLFLYAGTPFIERNGCNMWDIFAQYKVTYCLIVSTTLDKLEKAGARPGPHSNLEHFKIITTGAAPVKPQNCLYVKNEVKKDVFVSSQYGATESFGDFTGVDVNLPSYAGENQVPGLGLNIHCFNDDGKSVLGERGDMVIISPSIHLPVYIWKDQDNKILKENYLTKYPGVWCQNDEIWVNPETKGIRAIGRNDDTIKQYGERFAAGDIYFAIHDLEEIVDHVCVAQTNCKGDQRAVLFIKMNEGYKFTPEFKEKVEQKILKELWVECLPQVILETKEIPYNLNNKRMESVVRKIIATNQIPQVTNIKNPGCLRDFCDIPELVDFMKGTVCKHM